MEHFMAESKAEELFGVNEVGTITEHKKTQCT